MTIGAMEDSVCRDRRIETRAEALSQGSMDIMPSIHHHATCPLLSREREGDTAHWGDGHLGACHAVLQQPGMRSPLHTAADRRAAAGRAIDDRDVQRLIRATDHVEHVGNALAVHSTDGPVSVA